MVPLLLRPLARGASRIIAVSRYLADRLAELGLAIDPLVIPNVVPLTSPAPLPSAERHAIAHVSIMGPAKNLGALLQAVDRLRGAAPTSCCASSATASPVPIWSRWRPRWGSATSSSSRAA